MRLRGRPQVLERYVPSGAEGHDRGDLLSPSIAGATDYEHVEDRGVGLQDLFDFLGEDLLAAAVDGHRLPAQEFDGAIVASTGAVS